MAVKGLTGSSSSRQLLLQSLTVLSLHPLGSGLYFGKLDFSPPESCDNITAETRLLQYPFRIDQLDLHTLYVILNTQSIQS